MAKDLPARAIVEHGPPNLVANRAIQREHSDRPGIMYPRLTIVILGCCFGGSRVKVKVKPARDIDSGRMGALAFGQAG